ncbi:hypothetical protein GUJ93_ZPchr0008g11988 [Zizania palustris]|uniref:SPOROCYTELESS-like EAR-containing protein 2 n=1 Tax=Zizania palustris TaxID=103762 RepID=A0A8J5RGE0_ZIZPA|nr:hypothetical protein GUJ93_ZPchr0008g11988 [Zizania palustris]
MVQEHGSSNHLQQQLAKYGGGGVASTGVARASRKNKPKKVPQRGLGVAQLEKLRIEEQKKMEGGGATALSTQALHGRGSGLVHLPPPPLPLSALPSGPAPDGSAQYGFPPPLWNPVDPVNVKHPYKRSLCPQPPSPMVSTGLSLTTSSCHPTEPPSNQMYGNRSSVMAAAAASEEEERETAGMDRSWPFMFEGMTAFRTTTRARTPVAPFAARTTTGEPAGLADVGPDLTRYEFRTANYFSKENGRARDPAFLSLSSQSQAPHLIKQPHVMPSSYGDFSAMASQGGSVSSSSSQPFYSFMPLGPVRCERALSECKTDVSEGIDLELKLGNC